MIFDFTDLSFVDSAGIGTLVRIYVRHQRGKNGLSLLFRSFDSLGEPQAKRA